MPAAVDVGDHRLVQRHTVRLLVACQVVGGLGIGSAISVAGVLALQLSGSQVWAGGGGTAITLGAAMVAVPLARLAGRRGRRVSLTLGWSVAALGATTTIVAAATGTFWLMLVGMLGFGSGTASNLQSRYAATDLAEPGRRARDLSVVVWSTTLGSVLGPNLSGPGGAVGRALGLPALAGPFVFSAVGFAVAAALVWALMRPDPLLCAASRRPAATASGAAEGSALALVARHPRATLALAAIVVGHAVMVSVMTMTPVELAGHGAALTVIGLTISVHIAGMYGLSPVFGALTDRWGRVPVILLGQGLLALAVLTAGTSDGSPARLTAGLALLGLGWSAGLVAASTLLGESVPEQDRPRVQGLSDLLMNLMGAGGAASSGVLMGLVGFGGLNALVALLVLPVVVLAARAAWWRGSAADASRPTA